MTKEDLLRKKISAISLGCDKNRVDLEHMLYLLKEYGFEIVSSIEDAEIIIVNTCAFIKPAIIEAVENISFALQQKIVGKAQKIIVSGCFPQRNLKSLKENFPEVDYFLLIKENSNICHVIENLYDVKNTSFSYDETGRIVTHTGKYAYLKISDGCSNGCAYCTIPRIRGRFISVPIKQLVKEAKELAEKGYKELILVAQDTARYGEDIYGQSCLIDLLQELNKIKGIEWIRLQYIYPEWLSDELLEYINNQPKMCKYIDMPLQHIDDEILKSMNRKTGEAKSRELVDKIHQLYPNITLRTTFIVGLPGETRAKFNKLCKFIEEGKIHYATFFPYYREENTKAYYMKKQVFEFIKKKRLKKIINLQNIVINNINNKKIGQIEYVLIDDFLPDEKIFIGHTKNNSPNIDLCVIIEEDNVPKNINLKIGEIYKVKLIQIIENGFKGEII